LCSEHSFAIETHLLFPNFRKIDLLKSVDAIVDWLAAEIKTAPGLVVSLSGTDSMLTFVLCAMALEKLGRDPHQDLIGIHFRTERDEDNWPPTGWLSKYGCVQVWQQPKYEDQAADIKRWERIQSFAIENGRPWIVGSRNATEAAIGDFSIASNCCSLFPIVGLYKTEVLNICHLLGLPLVEINRSLNPDPDCDVACMFQNRRVVQSDCLTLMNLALLPEGDRLEVPSNLRAIYDEKVRQGEFRLNFHRSPEAVG